MSNYEKTKSYSSSKTEAQKKPQRGRSSNKKNVPNSKSNQDNKSRDTKFTSVNDSIFGNPIPAYLSSSGRDNDPNWYFLDGNIAEQASGISFNQYIGNSFPITFASSDTKTSATVETLARANYSTILSYGMNPSPGDVSSLQNGINMAALSTYSTLSSMNAKSTNYQPQDISILILSIGEVITIMEHIRRAFGIAFTYNQRNRTMPRQILDAMGFETDNFLDDIAQHRLQFNSKITAINKIPFLDNIAYLYKCANLYQKVYMDRDSGMSQLCFAKPDSTWVLDEAYNDKGSGLVTTELPGAYSEDNWNKWMKVLDDQIEALLTSSTFNYVYSDILNYSSKTGAKLLYMDYLREDYMIVPEYNRNFLLQMHNSTLLGRPQEQPDAVTTGNNVSCDVNKNKLVYDPHFKFSNVTTSSPIVDFETPSPTLEDKIEATRFTAVLKKIGRDDESGYAVISAIPDHYVTRMTVTGVGYARRQGDIITGNIIESNVLNAYATSTAGALAMVIKKLSALVNFDWFPTFYLITDEASGTEDAQLSIFGELTYFTTLDTTWFKRVNDLGFQALFTLR